MQFAEEGGVWGEACSPSSLEGCCRLNCVPQKEMLESEPQVSVNVASSINRTFALVMESEE